MVNCVILFQHFQRRIEENHSTSGSGQKISPIVSYFTFFESLYLLVTPKLRGYNVLSKETKS